MNAIHNGLRRGWIEYTAAIRTLTESANYVIVAGFFMVVLYLNRNRTVDGTSLHFPALALPGLLGMLAVYTGIVGAAYALASEREDGTLLRAKAVPNGMTGYVTGHILRGALEILTMLVVMLVPALILIDGLFATGLAGGLHLLWLFPLGLLATLPFGMVIGSLATSPRAIAGWGLMVVGALTFISGVFSPVTGQAAWVQGIAQVFPIYWLGLGMRSALLPDEVVLVEIGQSWRTLETIGVLGIWAVAGLLLAPVVLRRMARRESGAVLDERRRKVLQRL
ncbi:MAG TPA: ABC transporter permease [Actinophytocola sp.]|uniref:ABC transporter permease n=1 Tax=Actinophytocola sp. TaxID=1872138 RepID=UPI002DB8E409|nr:ABC transporter permease [Actinophytocola sp.]HEU5469533.1 ABC transporter permease [Actinophytocola sp.]